MPNAMDNKIGLDGGGGGYFYLPEWECMNETRMSLTQNECSQVHVYLVWWIRTGTMESENLLDLLYSLTNAFEKTEINYR